MSLSNFHWQHKTSENFPWFLSNHHPLLKPYFSYMVLYCLKHFQIHHSINLSQRSYEMLMERTSFHRGKMKLRAFKWLSKEHCALSKRFLLWPRTQALLGKQHSTWRRKHSHSSDGKHQRRNTCEMLKTQIFILPYLGLSLKGYCGRMLSLFGWTESSGVLIIFCFKFVPWTCITYPENKVFVFPN